MAVIIIKETRTRRKTSNSRNFRFTGSRAQITKQIGLFVPQRTRNKEREQDKFLNRNPLMKPRQTLPASTPRLTGFRSTELGRQFWTSQRLL
ncbi:hypothetical protein A4A49_62623 [Nicotiana attenuata]|uniref:Uncharacterized protein n=1 Tax=Nicotiana attenuata TaxID=49451 RepID=A0A1J6I3L6_NICAT|nr:hypothetical protein A4A49_62623 [Nicotiana attenuata]